MIPVPPPPFRESWDWNAFAIGLFSGMIIGGGTVFLLIFSNF